MSGAVDLGPARLVVRCHLGQPTCFSHHRRECRCDGLPSDARERSVARPRGRVARQVGGDDPIAVRAERPYVLDEVVERDVERVDVRVRFNRERGGVRSHAATPPGAQLVAPRDEVRSVERRDERLLALRLSSSLKRLERGDPSEVGRRNWLRDRQVGCQKCARQLADPLRARATQWAAAMVLILGVENRREPGPDKDTASIAGVWNIDEEDAHEQQSSDRRQKQLPAVPSPKRARLADERLKDSSDLPHIAIVAGRFSRNGVDG